MSNALAFPAFSLPRLRGALPRIAAALALGLAALAPQVRAADLTVFAAASMINAMEELGKNWQALSGDRVRFSFASSSTLAKQIEQGADAQIFVSADEPWADYLEQRKLLEPGTRAQLVGNQLVLVMPAKGAQTLDLGRGKNWLAQLPAGRIATGDPAHVPVGIYAREALTNLGLWAQVEPRLAPADSVRSALALVERGEAAAGIVYATDAAISSAVKTAGVFPEDSHKTITYPIAIIACKSSLAAKKLYDYLRSKEAAVVYRKYGFSPK
ncbi:MAG: molybdate ABC transporter substrate-binding protein [Candidatus Protistobacter heckmanni]|nr:molybdate ABC transporter substrate-binding protein [Candidatus Protistobacter heckmanni]